MCVLVRLPLRAPLTEPVFPRWPNSQSSIAALITVVIAAYHTVLKALHVLEFSSIFKTVSYKFRYPWNYCIKTDAFSTLLSRILCQYRCSVGLSYDELCNLRNFVDFMPLDSKSFDTKSPSAATSILKPLLEILPENKTNRGKIPCQYRRQLNRKLQRFFVTRKLPHISVSKVVCRM